MLAINSTNVIELANLTDTTTGNYINNATVIYSIVDKTGTEVVGGTLSYVASSNGTYRGSVSALTEFDHDTPYSVQITATAGGNTLFIEQTELAEYV